MLTALTVIFVSHLFAGIVAACVLYAVEGSPTVDSIFDGFAVIILVIMMGYLALLLLLYEYFIKNSLYSFAIKPFMHYFSFNWLKK